jgi:hypothetical protein
MHGDGISFVFPGNSRVCKHSWEGAPPVFPLQAQLVLTAVTYMFIMDCQ